ARRGGRRIQGRLMGSSDQLQRYGLAVLSHLVLIAAWHLFVTLGNVPSFVMPSPWATVHALVVPNYRWAENIVATASEIFAGYFLAVAIGIVLAVLFSWFRVLEMLLMPLLVSLNMIPKVALAPLFLVWFSYGVFPNTLIAFSIAFFPIVL